MSVDKRYLFEAVEACEMCSSPDAGNLILGQRLNGRQGLRTHRLQGLTTTIKRCRHCGLIYPNPLPIPAAISDHYQLAPEEYWHQNYFSDSDSYFSEQLQVASRLLGPSSPGRPWQALDLGCGVGKALQALMRAGFEVTGLEPSLTFWERCLERTGLSADRLLNRPVEDAEFDASTFDFVTFGAVFEHLYHPRACLERVLPWLRPGGVIHLEVPSSNWLIEHVYHRVLKLKGSEFTSFLSPMHPPFHLYSFARKSFADNQRRMGFCIVESRYDVCDVYYTPRLLRGLLEFIMRRTNTGMQLTLYLRKEG